MKNRAYSIFEIKAVDDDQRIIEGIATTIKTDRMDDVVVPSGGTFTLPLPLLYQHNSRQPIGQVIAAKVTEAGIEIRAQIAQGVVPFIDEAWALIKAGLVRGLSIGFRPLEDPTPIKGTFGLMWGAWEWLELSVVTVPANSDCSITTIKSIDDQTVRAASGDYARQGVVRLASTPGVSGPQSNLPKGRYMKTIAEQIASFEAKRAASTGRMNEIMAKAADEGRTLDETETQEYDVLKAEVKAVDDHIARLKDHETQMVARATPVSAAVGADPTKASQARGGAIISVKSNVAPGIKFTRYVMALARTRGNLSDALAVAKANKAWSDTTPEVEMVLRAAVAAGDTTSAGWASELVYAQNLANEFIEFLRPQTILGKIPNLTQIPFNVRMGSQTSASSAYWVGQGAPVPVSKLGTSEVRLGIAKAAGLVVLTEELVRSSSPSAELLVRSDLTKSIAQFLDQQFIDPDFAAVTNVSPGSVTNGVTPTAATGTDQAALRDDVQTLFGIWIAANLDPSAGVWIMPPATALAISLMLNPLGQPLYPTINMMGGTFFGLPVITSNTAVLSGSPSVGNIIVLLNAPEVLLADDGQVTIDASREAAIQMIDNPTNQSTDGTVATSMVSMFQTESVAIRATRFINWKKRRANAVAFIAGAAYK